MRKGRGRVLWNHTPTGRQTKITQKVQKIDLTFNLRAHQLVSVFSNRYDDLGDRDRTMSTLQLKQTFEPKSKKKKMTQWQ